MSDKKIEDIIQACRAVADQLEKVDPNDEAAVNESLNKVNTQGVCCNACQVISPCIPGTGNKCTGGCTVTSYVF